MELQFESKRIGCLQPALYDVQEQEQTQEIRIPDDMPDIERIVCAWGQCVLRGKEWHGDSIGVNGGVMAWVLYIGADGGEPKVVEAWLPMQCRWNFGSSKPEGNITTIWTLKGVDGRMLSARKLMVRANAQILAQALSPMEETVYAPQELPEDVQVLKNTYPMELAVEAGEKAFVLEDDLAVSGGTPAPEKIVSVRVMPRVNEQAVVGGKVIFRGDTEVKTVFIGEDGMMHSVAQTIPFSQFADLDRDYDKDATVAAMPVVSNLEIENRENSIGLKMSLVMQYVISDRVMMEMVEDAYSNLRNVKCLMKPMRIPMELDRNREKVDIDVEFPVQVGNVVDATVYPLQPMGYRDEGNVNMALSGDVQLLYYDESGELMAEHEAFRQNRQIPTGADTTVRSVLLDVNAADVHSGNGKICVQTSVTTYNTAISGKEMQMAAGLELDEMQKPDPGRPSLILRRAGEESLWEIAKNSGSTMDAIRNANGLDGEPVVGQMLMIPVS